MHSHIKSAFTLLPIDRLDILDTLLLLLLCLELAHIADRGADEHTERSDTRVESQVVGAHERVADLVRDLGDTVQLVVRLEQLVRVVVRTALAQVLREHQVHRHSLNGRAHTALVECGLEEDVLLREVVQVLWRKTASDVEATTREVLEHSVTSFTAIRAVIDVDQCKVSRLFTRGTAKTGGSTQHLLNEDLHGLVAKLVGLGVVADNLALERLGDQELVVHRPVHLPWELLRQELVDRGETRTTDDALH